MLGKLVPCGGGPPIPLLKTKLLVGRKPECDVTIPCSSVSSRHCTLEFEDGIWWVCDLESKNGTSVNGRRCDKQRILPDDILGVGRQRLVIAYQKVNRAASSTMPSKCHSDEDLAFAFLEIADPEDTVAQSVTINSAVVDSKSSALFETDQTTNNLNVPRPKTTADLGRLVPCGGGAPIPLRYPELVLGRSPECDVRIRFPSVSARHCKLNFDDGYWLVEDLNSTNGTWVDGDRCLFQCLLPESILALDKHRFAVHYVPRTNAAPPIVKRLFSQSLLEKAGLAKEFLGDRLSGQLLPDDSSDRPKRYNLLDPEDE